MVPMAMDPTTWEWSAMVPEVRFAVIRLLAKVFDEYLEMDVVPAGDTWSLSFVRTKMRGPLLVGCGAVSGGHICNLATLPEYRGLGVATRIMKSLMETGMDGYTVVLQPGSEEVLRGFYARLGFEHRGKNAEGEEYMTTIR